MTVPVYISLTYDKFKTLQFPVNPESLERIIPSSGRTYNVIGQGEINVPEIPKLSTLTIESFFWNQAQVIKPAMYINWLKVWQKSKKPALLVVTKFNYSMDVTCENFKYSVKAGEEDDFYFTLDLKEYKSYKSKKLNQFEKIKVLDTIKAIAEKGSEYLGSSVLIEPPIPSRISNKQPFGGTYTVKNGDSLLTISKKLSGDSSNWKDLYEENKDVFNDLFSTQLTLMVGLNIKIPEKWE